MQTSVSRRAVPKATGTEETTPKKTGSGRRKRSSSSSGGSGFSFSLVNLLLVAALSIIIVVGGLMLLDMYQLLPASLSLPKSSAYKSWATGDKADAIGMGGAFLRKQHQKEREDMERVEHQVEEIKKRKYEQKMKQKELDRERHHAHDPRAEMHFRKPRPGEDKDAYYEEMKKSNEEKRGFMQHFMEKKREVDQERILKPKMKVPV